SSSLQIGSYDSITTTRVNGPVLFDGGMTANAYLKADGPGVAAASRLVAAGNTLTLTDAQLVFLPSGDFSTNLGTEMVFIENQTGHPVVGTFDGLPEVALTIVDGVTIKIAYVG